jgi:hypothetical protein
MGALRLIRYPIGPILPIFDIFLGKATSLWVKWVSLIKNYPATPMKNTFQPAHQIFD